MLDFNKALELEDGTPVEFICIDDDGHAEVKFSSKERGYRTRWFFPTTGDHIFGTLPRLRNTNEPAKAKPVLKDPTRALPEWGLF